MTDIIIADPLNAAGAGHSSRRRQMLCGLAAAIALPSLAWSAQPPRIEVWKDPSCGCCKDWVAHMHANGFQVSVHETGNEAARRRLNMPDRYGSCHTALIAGYAIEGHVPARDVRRLLADKPAAVGLAVPGMPIGSPGMDGPEYRGRRDPYQVLLVRRDGTAGVYQKYG